MVNEHETEVSDLGTPERAAKAITEVSSTQENKRRRRILTQVPLDAYLHLHRIGRGGINFRQWEAGDKLYRIFSRSSLIRAPSPMAEVHIPPAKADRTSNSQYDALEDYLRAVDHLGRFRIGTIIVVNVCCYGYELRDLRLPHYQTSNQMMARMKESLDELADFFGLPHYPEAKG